MSHADAVATAIGMYGSNRGLSPINATMQFENEIIAKQIEYLAQYKELYINRVGGYHFKYNENADYTDIIHKDILVFPDTKMEDIHIKKFPLGNHYYVRIGNTELNIDGNIKWNTYEEAKRQVLNYIKNN